MKKIYLLFLPFRLIFVLFIYGVSILTPISSIYSAGLWDIEKYEANEALDKGLCEQAWRKIWKWAKSGNIEARAITSRMIVNERVMPTSLLSIGKNNMNLFKDVYREIVLHGAIAGDDASTDLLPEIFKLDAPASKKDQDYKEAFLGCIDAHKRPETCEKLGIKSGIVRPYDFVVINIGVFDGEKNKHDDSCWEKPKPGMGDDNVENLLRMK